MGTKTLGDILSDRESIALEMQTVLDEGTEPWGVKVERVEVTLIMTSMSSIILMALGFYSINLDVIITNNPGLVWNITGFENILK